MAKRVRIVVTGRIQNVGYRAFARRVAAELELRGWVANLYDQRSVELEVEGSALAIEKLIDALREGPTAARVRDITVTSVTPENRPDATFEIR